MKKLLGDLLLENKLCNEQQIQECLLIQKNLNGTALLGDILVEKQYATEDDICRMYAIQYDLTFLNGINPDDIDDDLMQKIDADNQSNMKIFLDKCFLILKGNKLICSKPSFDITDTVNKHLPEYDIEITTKSNIYSLINSKYFLNKVVNELSANDVLDEALNIVIAKNSPNMRIKYAIDSYFITYDTISQTIDNLRSMSIDLGKKIINILASRDKTIVLKPGETCTGRMKHNSIEIRMEFLPIQVSGDTIFEAVLRMHYNSVNRLTNINNLGLYGRDVDKLLSISTFSNGIVISTGPTGSGKTTTFYSILKNIAETRKQIYTIEDPVETRLSETNITQLSVTPGLDFNDAIRSLLRCEPKVILIGEIRDKETAESAINASETGHLVLTTVHSNSALSVFRRLAALNINPIRVIENIRMITSQRLYIPLCEHCRVESELDKFDTQRLSIIFNNIPKELFVKYSKIGLVLKELKSTYKHNRNGCSYCNGTGYANCKKVLIEIVTFDDEVRRLVMKEESIIEVESQLMYKRDYIPLRINAYSLLCSNNIDIQQYYSMIDR